MDIEELLFPVTCIIVRSGNAAHLQALEAIHNLAVGLEVNNQLTIHTLKEGIVRHTGLEQRNINAGNLLYDSFHLDLLSA